MSLLSTLFPGWALSREQKRGALRALAEGQRHYEAVDSASARNSGWAKLTGGDSDALVARSGAKLRAQARDLMRNNGFVRRGVDTLVDSVVGWGASPNHRVDALRAPWAAWAGDESVQADAAEGTNFVGLQRQLMRSLIVDGEVLVRVRARLPQDGLAAPMALQLLEVDYIDESRDNIAGEEGGIVRRGIELDAIGRVVAYWLFPEHPGSAYSQAAKSVRVPWYEVLHLYRPERPGAMRGVSWLAPVILDAKDLASIDGAELMKQRVAACLTAFVTDLDGAGAPLGLPTGAATESGSPIDSLEPGAVVSLPPGKNVTFSAPPSVTTDDLTRRTLRRMAAALSVPVEAMTGDYTQTNFSSARMSRIGFQQFVRSVQTTLLLPQFLGPVYREFSSRLLGKTLPPPSWTFPALPMLEPEKEGLAAARLVRAGAMTYSEMVREQGYEPHAHFAEYAADQALLDSLGIKLDSDVRATSQAGLTQARAGMAPTAADPSLIPGDPNANP